MSWASKAGLCPLLDSLFVQVATNCFSCFRVLRKPSGLSAAPPRVLMRLHLCRQARAQDRWQASPYNAQMLADSRLRLEGGRWPLMDAGRIPKLTRTVRGALITPAPGVVSSDDLIAMPETQWRTLRNRISDGREGHPSGLLTRCLFPGCGGEVYISERAKGPRRYPYFAHRNGQGLGCPWHPNSRLSADNARAAQYQGNQVSPAHEFICAELARLTSPLLQEYALTRPRPPEGETAALDGSSEDAEEGDQRPLVCFGPGPSRGGGGVSNLCPFRLRVRIPGTTSPVW